MYEQLITESAAQVYTLSDFASRKISRNTAHSTSAADGARMAALSERSRFYGPGRRTPLWSWLGEGVRGEGPLYGRERRERDAVAGCCSLRQYIASTEAPTSSTIAKRAARGCLA